MQEVSVKPRSFFKHSIVCDAVGKEIHWSFTTKNKNISFGLFFRKTGGGGGGAEEAGRGSVAGHIPPSTTISAVASFSASLVPEPLNSRDSKDLVGRSSLTAAPLSPSLPTDSALKRINSKGSSGATKSNHHNHNHHHCPFGDDLEEIIPVSHFESSKFTVRGSHLIKETPGPGTYVLLFDNTFSVNTSKKLNFSVAIKDPDISVVSKKTEYEGWIYKKGNRKRQGYSKRWLKVDSNGYLQYFKSSHSDSRGSVSLASAAVHINHDGLLIDIDSGRNVFHFKAISPLDFEAVLAVIESHNTSLGFTLPRPSATSHHSSYESSLAASNSEQSLSYVDATEDVRRAAFRDQGNLILNTVGMVALANNKIMEILDTIKVKIEFKSPAKDLLPLIIKMVEQAQSIQSNSSMVQTDFILFNKLISTTLDQLEVSEMALTNSVTDNNKLRKLQGIEPVTRNTFVRNSLNGGGGGGGGGKGRRGSATSSLLAKSIESRSDIFYDAETPVAADLSDEFSSDTEDVAAVAVVGGGRGRSGGDEENSSPCDLDKSDSNGDMDDLAVKFSSTNTSSTTATSNTTATSSIASAATTSISFVTRRKALPAPTASMENINLLSILRNNIGKDLSTVTMPIALNEPINLLQKLCEELEYSDLLDKAANCEDQVERLLLISAFAVSGYASSIYRPGRKPFNPLLGETYECVRPDKGFRFVAEKVSHHPPIMACYAEGMHYRFWQENLVKPKFWGKSMELIPTGIVNVELTNLKEHYTWAKVTTCTRNIFSSARYLEHYGTMRITNHKTGHYCEIQFLESGFFTSAKNELSGAAFGPTGEKLCLLRGKWDESLNKFQESAPNSLEVLWRSNPAPPNHVDNYGFTSFALELNELTPDLEGKLLNTDTRFRPDQRQYELGQLTSAEAEKTRLEQKQREYRKKMETKDGTWTPRFFEQRNCIDEPKEASLGKNGKSWQYRDNSYFEHRGKFDVKMELW